ncbi:hypothetical protein EFK07_02820 [Pseudomonas putida]|uniref:Uncharacterized protein n=1 Tax=Pseudomonas putida TaxID=303 RepID=A0A3M8TJX1_PSEPU|nr:hypothetical protein EFK07_02820 [Pseudomonas putida]
MPAWSSLRYAVRCRSGLVSRKGCKAAPAIPASLLSPWGRVAALSRHKAAPAKSEQVYWLIVSASNSLAITPSRTSTCSRMS